MAPRMLLCVLGCIAFAGCTHHRYQYKPRPAEAQALNAAGAQFLSTVNDETSAEAPKGLPLDLDGRLALLELLQKVVVDRTAERGPSRGLLSVAALLLAEGEYGSPFTAQELQGTGWQVLQSAITERFDLDPVEKALIGAVLGRQGAPKVDEEALRAELNRRAAEADVRGCEADGPRASYSADILGHVDGPATERFRQWRDRVASAHLVTLTCEGARGLLLLTRDHGAQTPQIAVWQFFTEEQWAALAPKLEEVWGR